MVYDAYRRAREKEKILYKLCMSLIDILMF